MQSLAPRIATFGRWFRAKLNPRFSLRALFVLTTLVAFGLAYVVRCERQRLAVDQILAKSGSEVFYQSTSVVQGRRPEPYYTMFGPLPIDYYEPVLELKLSGGSGQPAALHLLRSFSRLRQLDVDYPSAPVSPFRGVDRRSRAIPLKSQEWKVLESLGQLENLSVHQRYLDMDVAAHIARAPRLQNLSIYNNTTFRMMGVDYGSTPTPEVILALAKSPTITELSLWDQLDDDHIDALAEWRQLSVFHLAWYDCPEDTTLKIVRKLAIEELMLGGSSGVYHGDPTRIESNRLKKLDSGCRYFFSLAGFQSLLESPSLRQVHVSFDPSVREWSHLELLPPEWCYDWSRDSAATHYTFTRHPQQ